MSPEKERDGLNILGIPGFYYTFIKDLHVDSEPFCELMRENVAWTKNGKKLIEKKTHSFSAETILALANPKNPLHVKVDSSSIGSGSSLIQEIPQENRPVSFNFRPLVVGEQKMSNLHR